MTKLLMITIEVQQWTAVHRQN